MQEDSELTQGRVKNNILIDTGEKGEEAGERIALRYGPSKLKAIFLHTVSDRINRKEVVVPLERGKANNVPVYYFERTYCRNGIPRKSRSNQAVQRVVVGAISASNLLVTYFM